MPPERRLRVFVSSALRELSAERQAARTAVEGMRLTPVLFELPDDAGMPRSLYRSYVENSDVFVGIYGHGYGWVGPDMAISSIEDEYDLSAGRPRLIYVKSVPDRDPRLEELLARIKGDGVSYKTFYGPDELEDQIREDLALVLTERFQSEDAPHRSPLPVGGLPADTAPFVGRKREVEEVRALIEDDSVRLVTLTGPGGTGKTRLATEAARCVESAFEDGAFFVGLAATRDPALVALAVARGLGRAAAGAEEASTTVKDALGDKHALLLLDNFEQVLPAAPFIADLISACPRLKIVVTSRIVLRIQAEHEYFVPPLALAAGDSLDSADAVSFFLERARAVRPGLHVDDETLHVIAEICERLDGLPLAIELAAARVRLLPPRNLLEHMSKGLEILSGGARDMPERHRAIRATIRWSHDLLNERERNLFASLGAFASSFTLEACESICGVDDPDVLETLSSLIDKSIVHPDTEAFGEPRFVMLQTIHEFALEQLQDSENADAVRDCHAHFYMEMIRAAGVGLKSGEQNEWLQRLEVEFENVRCAVEWCLTREDYESVGECAYRIWLFLWLSGRLREGRTWSERALAHADSMSERGAARSLLGKAAIAFWQADYMIGLPLMHQAMETLEQLGEDEGVALCLLGLGMSAPFLGDIEEGKARLRRALDIFTKIDNEWGTVVARNGMCWLLTMVDQVDGQYPLFEEALERARSFGTEIDQAMAGANLGRFYVYQGDPRGVPYLAEALERYASLGNKGPTANVVEGLAEAAFLDGDLVRAARLIGMATAFRDSIGALALAGARERVERLIPKLREALGDAAYDKAFEEAAALPFKRAIDEARHVPAARAN